MADTRLAAHALILCCAAACLTGCAGPSVWERSFQPEPGFEARPEAAAPLTPPQSVVIRDAPWGRVGPALAAEAERIVASDVHRDDWSPEQAREAEVELLEALQLPIPPQDAELLGRSHFTTTATPDPDAGELRAFAASLGADYAIWSRQTLGKAERIVREPVWTDSWRWDRVWDDDRGRYDYVRRWDRDTVWVPVVVERDEVRWIVFYVRRND